MYSVAAAAEHLGISSEQVLKLIREKRLHAVNVGSGRKRATWRVPLQSLTAFVAAGHTPKQKAGAK